MPGGIWGLDEQAGWLWEPDQRSTGCLLTLWNQDMTCCPALLRVSPSCSDRVAPAATAYIKCPDQNVPLENTWQACISSQLQPRAPPRRQQSHLLSQGPSSPKTQPSICVFQVPVTEAHFLFLLFKAFTQIYRACCISSGMMNAVKHLEIPRWHSAAFTKWNRRLFNNALFRTASFCSARLMFPFKRISILISPAEDQPPSTAWAIRRRVIGRSPHLEERMEGKRIGAFRWMKFADSVSGEVKKEWKKGQGRVSVQHCR